jgi:hypothetical protein
VTGVCLSGSGDPELVVNLSEEGAPSTDVFQLTAGLVDTTEANGVSDTLYRGTGTWLGGPNAGSPPVPFVADVVTPNQGGLMVAFFSTVPGLTTPSAGANCVASDGAQDGSTTTTSTSDPC